MLSGSNGWGARNTNANAKGIPPTADAARSKLTTKTIQRRSSSLLGDRLRRRPDGQITFPAAADRSAAEAPPRKEQADQSIDLAALHTVSRTTAARTFLIVRAVHRPGPRKPVGCRRMSLA
jgi:hypothetical protein